MTREYALLKLLALEPATRADLHAVTGWGITETNAVLDTLIHEKKVGWRNGSAGAPHGYRQFMPRQARA